MSSSSNPPSTFDIRNTSFRNVILLAAFIVAVAEEPIINGLFVGGFGRPAGRDAVVRAGLPPGVMDGPPVTRAREYGAFRGEVVELRGLLFVRRVFLFST